MKTTIELPNDLLVEAKAAAARRRTTLKAMIEHALRRELSQGGQISSPQDTFVIDNDGLPLLKKNGSTTITNEMVYQMLEDEGI